MQDKHKNILRKATRCDRRSPVVALRFLASSRPCFVCKRAKTDSQYQWQMCSEDDNKPRKIQARKQ